MAREAIRLGVEPHGKGIRYKRMHKRHRWKSVTFPADTRENKRAAWAAFCEWRATVPERAPKADPLAPARQVIGTRIKALADYSSLTGLPEDAKKFGAILKAVPDMSEDQLLGIASFLMENEREIDDRRRAVARLQEMTDPDMTARKLADEYIAATARNTSSGNTGQVRRGLELFCEVFGPDRSLETLSEKHVKEHAEFLGDKVNAGELAKTTAYQYQQVFRSFVTAMAEDHPQQIRIPANLRSKRLLLKRDRKEPVTYTVEEVKLILEAAVPRTKLFILLMLNMGCYQGDLADLTADEIDWQAGRIIRPRSKTERAALTLGKTKPPKANWKLWRETWELLQEFGNRDGLVFISENGTPLITEKATTRNDVIRSAFHRTIAKLKRNGKLPKHWHKTLKGFRKTGSNVLQAAEEREHAAAYQQYLSHSVSREHYLTSGKIIPTFDAAVSWLGKQFGVA